MPDKMRPSRAGRAERNQLGTSNFGFATLHGAGRTSGGPTRSGALSGSVKRVRSRGHQKLLGSARQRGQLGSKTRAVPVTFPGLRKRSSSSRNFGHTRLGFGVSATVCPPATFRSYQRPRVSDRKVGSRRLPKRDAGVERRASCGKLLALFESTQSVSRASISVPVGCQCSSESEPCEADSGHRFWGEAPSDFGPSACPPGRLSTRVPDNPTLRPSARQPADPPDNPSARPPPTATV